MHTCEQCGVQRIKMKKCGGCVAFGSDAAARFCCTECSYLAWPQHKQICPKVAVKAVLAEKVVSMGCGEGSGRRVANLILEFCAPKKIAS